MVTSLAHFFCGPRRDRAPALLLLHTSTITRAEVSSSFDWVPAQFLFSTLFPRSAAEADLTVAPMACYPAALPHRASWHICMLGLMGQAHWQPCDEASSLCERIDDGRHRSLALAMLDCGAGPPVSRLNFCTHVYKALYKTVKTAGRAPCASGATWLRMSLSTDGGAAQCAKLT